MQASDEVEQCNEDIESDMTEEGMEHANALEESLASSTDETIHVSVSIDDSNDIEYLRKQLAEANKKVEIANKLLIKSARKRKQWKNTHERQRRTIKKLKNNQSQMKLALKEIFNDDQMEALVKKSSRGMKWSNATIQKSLRLKFACGSTGYDELQAQKLPLPSSRSLRRKLQNIDFEEGISEKAFELLEASMAHIQDNRGRDCVMALDEMALKPSRDFDPSTETYCGESSFATSEGTLQLFPYKGGTSAREFTCGMDRSCVQ